MIKKIVTSRVLNYSLERALNSRFGSGRNIALFVALFISLSYLAVERIVWAIFNRKIKLFGEL